MSIFKSNRFDSEKVCTCLIYSRFLSILSVNFDMSEVFFYELSGEKTSKMFIFSWAILCIVHLLREDTWGGVGGGDPTDHCTASALRP